MKKFLFCLFALCACAGVVLSAQQPVVAVAPFDAISGISTADANIITRMFFIRLGNTSKVKLVERDVVDRIIQEHLFQKGDWVNQQKTAELGKALPADWIVRGELEKYGESNNILISVQFYDIKTFEFKGGDYLRIASADEAYDKMEPLVDSLIKTISDTVAVKPRQYGWGQVPRVDVSRLDDYHFKLYEDWRLQALIHGTFPSYEEYKAEIQKNPYLLNDVYAYLYWVMNPR
jgi:TolB-like protein